MDTVINKLLAFRLVLVFFCFSLNVVDVFAQSKSPQDALFEKGFDLFKVGYESNNTEMKDRGLKQMEKAANNGSGLAAFNLGALYNSPLFSDQEKKCFWTLKSANLNYVNAFWGAATCEISANRAGEKSLSFEKYAMHWIRKIANVGEAEDREVANNMIKEWETAKSEQASKGTSAYITLSSLFTSMGIDSISIPPSNSTKAKSGTIYVCKIYCQSSSGPITRQEVTTTSLREAAHWANENADQICKAKGHSNASYRKLTEDQCSRK
jgi:TPR repeat protein